MSSAPQLQESREPVSVRLANGESPAVVFEHPNIQSFVREVFDGAVGDVGPFASLIDAEVGVRAALARRLRRSLDASELSFVDALVRIEWDRRS